MCVPRRRVGRAAVPSRALTFRAAVAYNRPDRAAPVGPRCLWLPSFMRILMIAPEPFFEPRGTPFSEYHRIRALLELGHTVDLVTYPFGQDGRSAGPARVPLPAAAVPAPVGIGPSLAESPARPVAGRSRPLRRALDGAVRRGALARRRRRDRHRALGALLGMPHVYDMHSSLPQQLANFAYSRSRVLRWRFDFFERAAVRHSKVVIVICPELRRIVQRGAAGQSSPC